MTSSTTHAPRTALGDEAIARLFAEHGLRCTRQRLALYRALAEHAEHPTAEALFEQSGEDEQTRSLATVYNTLEAFCRAGLAQKIDGQGGPARYDATVHDHLHVRDKTTGDVRDVPDDLSEQILDHLPRELIEELERRVGFSIQRVQIEFQGRFR